MRDGDGVVAAKAPAVESGDSFAVEFHGALAAESDNAFAAETADVPDVATAGKISRKILSLRMVL